MFIKIYLFFLLLNIALMIMHGYADDMGQTAIANAIEGDYLGPKFYNFTDNTNSLTLNATDTTNSTITGHAGDNSFFDPITEPLERAYAVGEMAIDVITGGFIINVMDAFAGSMGIDFPPEFLFGLQVLVGFINFFFVLYIITGRSIVSFT